MDLPVELSEQTKTESTFRRSPRILMLSIVAPQLEHNGAATVTRGLIKLLESSPIAAQVDCVAVRPEPFRWHRLVQARSLLRRYFSNLPLKADFLYSKRFCKDVVARTGRQHYDLVMLNGSDLLWILDYIPRSISRILVAHNIEHLLFSSQIQTLNWWYRPLGGLLRRDCLRLQDYELEGIRRIGDVIFLSGEDAAYASRVRDGFRSTTIPPVFAYESRTRPRKKLGPILEIGYVGNFRWWPNQLGLRWFANKILPFVTAPVRLNLFGNPGGRLAWTDPRIVEHGVVEEIEQIWATCDLIICPVFSTGGVCVKFAEAVYNRMPVLSTRDGARGLQPGDDPAIVFLDQPGEWIEFLNSPAARELAQRRVSEGIAERFSIGRYKNQITQLLANKLSPNSVAEVHG